MRRRERPKRHNRRWRTDEDEALRTFAPEYTDRQIGVLLDRTTLAIAARRSALCVHRGGVVTGSSSDGHAKGALVLSEKSEAEGQRAMRGQDLVIYNESSPESIRIGDLWETVVALRGERLRCDREEQDALLALEHSGPHSEDEALRLYEQKKCARDRRHVIDLEALIVELDAVRLSIDLNRARQRQADRRGVSDRQQDILLGEWLRLEQREDELDAEIKRRTNGRLTAARIGWPAAEPSRMPDLLDTAARQSEELAEERHTRAWREECIHEKLDELGVPRLIMGMGCLEPCIACRFAWLKANMNNPAHTHAKGDFDPFCRACDSNGEKEQGELSTLRGMFDARTGTDETYLVCPKCRFNCVHINTVSVLTKPHSVEVDAQGIHLKPPSPGGYGRGSGIAVYCYCESGHSFVMELGFHKGQTYVTNTYLKDLPIRPEGGVAVPEELWRD